MMDVGTDVVVGVQEQSEGSSVFYRTNITSSNSFGSEWKKYYNVQAKWVTISQKGKF